MGRVLTYDTLSLTPRSRGRELGYLDFAINDRPLCEILHDRVGGRVGIFGSPSGKSQVRYAKQLLLRAPSEFWSGRAPLYVCERCGDLGCGAVSVFVSRREECIVWSKFGSDSTCFKLVPPLAEEHELEVVEPAVRDFWFEAVAYERVLAQFSGGVRLSPR